MPTIRRNDHAPRLELLPMIDVIFLLLTFFIYSLLFMVRADVLPVQLIPLAGAQRATQRQLHVLMLASDGAFFFDRQPMTDSELDAKLHELAAEPTGDAPRLYLTVAAKSAGVDRGPLFVELLVRVRAAGISDFAIVGPPARQTQTDSPPKPVTESVSEPKPEDKSP